MRRGMFAGLAVVLCLGLGSMACGGDGGTPTEQETTGSITGSVRTQTDPVQGATVALSGGGSTVTNASGSYTFNDLEAGTYTVTVTLPDGIELADGQTAAKTVTVTAGKSTTASWNAHDPNAPKIVRMSGVSFSPSTLTISPGTKVRWVVEDGSHTITPEDGGQAGVWTDPGIVSTGATFEHTFNTPSEVYDYFCSPHQSAGMTGTITVTAN